jgi:hypothetical protein
LEHLGQRSSPKTLASHAGNSSLGRTNFQANVLLTIGVGGLLHWKFQLGATKFLAKYASPTESPYLEIQRSWARNSRCNPLFFTIFTLFKC